jgi:hypothetical protein
VARGIVVVAGYREHEEDERPDGPQDIFKALSEDPEIVKVNEIKDIRVLIRLATAVGDGSRYEYMLLCRQPGSVTR